MKFYVRKVDGKMAEIASPITAMDRLMKVLAIPGSRDEEIANAARTFFEAYCIASIIGCEKELFEALAEFPPDILPF